MASVSDKYNAKKFHINQFSDIIFAQLLSRFRDFSSTNSCRDNNPKTIYGSINEKVENRTADIPLTMAVSACEGTNVIRPTIPDSGDFFVENGQLVRKYGIHWVIAALFIVADMAGGGIVALPTAIVRCSLSLGITLLLVMALLATSSSILLGKTWVILLRLYPIYRTHCRKPFAEMGYRALGPGMKRLVSLCLNITQFGASTVFLILIAKNTDDFLRAIFKVDIGMCAMISIITILIFPITLLKSPQDFWPVVVLGMVTTGIAVLFVCIGASLDWRCSLKQNMPDLSASNALLAMGTIMFSYGGHSALPTIQHDMRRPSDFTKSSILAFFLITVMNLIAVLFGTLTYGDSLGDSVINSIQTVWIQQAINLMILAHCLLTFTLIINPLNQEIEEYFNVPQKFTFRRVIVRVVMMMLAAFLAASVPTFGSIISVIGAVAFMLISMIFPCLFYLYLSAAEKCRNESLTNAEIFQVTSNEQYVSNTVRTDATVLPSIITTTTQTIKTNNSEYVALDFREVIRRTKPYVLFLCGIICCVGSISAAIATVTSIAAIITTNLETPCYVRLLSLSKMDDSAIQSVSKSVTYCCGEFLNMSLYEPRSCTPRRENYYKGNIIEYLLPMIL